ncbi:kinetoplast DNA-associated protein, putative [Roseobacter sp. GAI101]|uniref:kinetoplast DNA-associated protein, putative n=1 Tax=Roseobacter sp. (strain GAI101) TaxID=391589 RepID=UPI0001871967|nr:kinetoplast DNA-associated protein, putative [Roseobacter sp. GAI101]EEB84352.1 kinetoplast DNA-associated protein, putative [Roseobacter sp. GAI101]
METPIKARYIGERQMTLTEEQAAFIDSYILGRRAWDDARKAERQAELAALSGKIKAAEKRTDAEGDPEHLTRQQIVANLQTNLEKTGRLMTAAEIGAKTKEDKKKAKQAVAERQEAHLQDILLKDEDGINIGRIVDAMVPPPDKKFRELATKPLTEDLDPRTRSEIETAKRYIDDYDTRVRAAQEQIAAEYEAQVLHETDASRTARDAKNAAMHALAESHGQRSLAHHASRHGAHTTDDDQVRRVATGFAPDNVPAKGTATMTETLRTGENVEVALMQEQGPNASNVGSRFASAFDEMQMIEELLIDVQGARRRGEIDEGASIKKEVVVDAAKPVIGHQAIPVHDGSKYVKLGTTDQLPSSGQLKTSKTALDNAATMRDRIKSTGIEKNVRAATMIMRGLPDGTYRLVTAYPNSSVTGESFLEENTATPLKSGKDAALADKSHSLARAEAELTEADQEVRDSAKAVEAASAQSDAAKDTYEKAILAEAASLPAWDSDNAAAHTTLAKLQSRARNWSRAKMAFDGMAQMESDFATVRMELGKDILNSNGVVAACQGQVGIEQGNVAAVPPAANNASNADKKLAKAALWAANDLLRAAQNAVLDAQRNHQFLLDTQTALNAQIQTFSAARKAALENADSALKPMDDAYAEAVVASSKEQADQAKQAAIDSAKTAGEYTAAKIALEAAKVASDQAKLAQAIALEAVGQHDTKGPKSAATLLEEAAKEGPEALSAARKSWEEDMQAVAAHLEYERAELGKEAATLKAAKNKAAEVLLAAETAEQEAAEALQKLIDDGVDQSSPEFNKAINLVVDLGGARNRAEANAREASNVAEGVVARFEASEREDKLMVGIGRAQLATAIARQESESDATNVNKKKALDLALAKEDALKKSLDHEQAAEGTRLANASLRVVEQELEAATDALDRLSPTSEKMKDPTIGDRVKSMIATIDKIAALREQQEQVVEKAVAAQKEKAEDAKAAREKLEALS